MLNYSLSKVTIFFSSEFFPSCQIEKYEDWLKHINYPFKHLEDFIIESIQNIQIPGINVPSLTLQNMPNGGKFGFHRGDEHPTTMNRTFEASEPWFNSIEGNTITLTCRNQLLNWMYFYEMMYNRYKRNNRVEQFYTIITLYDVAEIPMIRLKFSDSWVKSLPPLDLSFNSAFNDSKTFDVVIEFNDFDVDFAIPEFQKINIEI